MKNIIFTSILFLSACANNKDYIIAPRTSPAPQEVIRDRLECRELVKPLLIDKNSKILGVPKRLLTKSKWNNPNYDPIKSCLIGRGHSVLN